MLIYEIVTNRKGETIEDTGPYESPTENITELFRLLESKHGRSMGSISKPLKEFPIELAGNSERKLMAG